MEMHAAAAAAAEEGVLAHSSALVLEQDLAEVDRRIGRLLPTFR
jgi:hypothetical protein